MIYPYGQTVPYKHNLNPICMSKYHLDITYAIKFKQKSNTYEALKGGVGLNLPENQKEIW